MELNNLNELNDMLFNLLRSRFDDKINTEKVDDICKISDKIIQNAKTQINVVSKLKGLALPVENFGLKQGVKPLNSMRVKIDPEADLYEQKIEFALSLGYKNLTDAFSKHGRTKFENEFKELTKRES